jgi:hypothetical protein
MGKVKIPYYVVRHGRGYWQPTKRMREAGYKIVACGQDGPTAWNLAYSWNKKWQTTRTGIKPQFERAPPGSLEEAFGRYRATKEWLKKKPRTREEWERCWSHLSPIFGDIAPSTVTLEDISEFRAAIAKRISEREAHRCIKIWRALWKIAAALKYCTKEGDPSSGVRNTEPKPRQAVWAEGEIVRAAKSAWRRGYYGLAAIIAVGWDSSLSPVDVRTITKNHMKSDEVGTYFAIPRAKTGRAAAGTLGRRSQAILEAYLAKLGIELTNDAPIFRNRSGDPYSKDTLGDDFRDIRLEIFGENEKRTLADMRRSGSVEAIRGGAGAEELSSKLANDLSTSNALHKTYVPVDLETVRTVDAARKKGRRKA